MKSFVYEQLPGRVVFGAGSFSQLIEEVDRLASRVLLVSGAAAKAVADQAVDALGGRLAGRISEVKQHVPEKDAIDARRLAKETDADGIVTIGGGSATGLAKAVALDTGLVILAVPTTYAGSEMTSIYGITSGGRKRTGRDIRALPKTVIYDPVLTLGLPSDVTAATGLNAMAHCIEGLYARENSPVTEMLAEEGIRALARALPDAVRQPEDLDARSEALYGAYLAGTVLAAAGMALHHQISHVLGGSYGLPHGPINSALLPHVVRFNEPAAPTAIARVARALGAEHAPSALYDLAASMGAPTNLAELGLDEGKLEEAARLTVESSKWNPRPVTEDDVLAILRDAYAGSRPSRGLIAEET